MVCHTLRLALLIGAITAMAAPAWANHGSSGCCDSAPSANCGSTAPAYRTITVTECVPETYTQCVTRYRTECRTETYDTVRHECVPVCKERVCNVTKRIPCVQTVTKKVCHTETCYEERCVNKTCYKYVQETCMQKKCVRRGHWEYQCVPKHSLFGNGGGFCGGHGHRGGDCCDPCPTQCVQYRTKKVWVSCPEYIECPVTVCRKVCYTVPTTCRVPVCKTVWRDVTCQVCTYKCVTECVTQKYTCYQTTCVPYQATRTCRVCVPYTETVTCTRYVARQVCRQVPCNDTCAPACTTSCCETSCCRPAHRCGGLFAKFGRGRHNGDCCRTDCCN